MCHALNKSGDFTIVSGGADGHAQICKDTGKVFGALKGQASVQGECSISGVGAQLTSRINEASALGRQVEDKFKSYSFVCDDGLLMVTSYGHVLFGKIQAPTSDMSDGIPANIFWTYITTCPDLGNSSLVVGVPVASIGFFTGASGKVYSFNSMTHVTAELIDVHSKPRAILADYVSLLGPNSNLICLFVSDSSGAARLLLMRENQLEDKQSIFSSLIVPVGKQDAIFSMKCHSARSGCLRLFLGTRTGKVMMYTWSEQVERSNPGSDDFKLNKTCIWTSHEDSITSLLVYESTLCDMGGPCQYLLTTARDGSYAIHKIEASDIDPTPVLMHRAYPPLGPNLEGAYFDNVNQHLILYGFRGIDFVGHDEALRKDVFTVDAGGAHRAWAFKPHTSSDGSLSLIFAWTRAGKLHFILPRNHGSHTFKSGGHGREIKACAIRPGQQRGCDGFKQIVATGAEDTHIRLFEHSHLSGLTERSGLDCISILTKHNTGVQQLQWSEDGDYLFSGGGCEEFFVWRIRRMPLLKVGVVCEASLNSSNHVSDLRITGVDVGSLDLFRDVMDHSTRRFKILLGFSNSTLRLYELSLSNSEGSWSQIWSSSYTSCCLTKSQFLAPTMNEPHGVSKNRTAHSDNILGAATDGHLVVLYPYASSTPPPAFQVHQNSIKALDKVSLPTTDPQKSVHVVLSGGDDNVLAITILTFDNTSTKGDTTSSARFSAHERNEHQSVSRETVILPRAHAASVSAVKILPSSYSDSIHGDEQHDTNRYRLSVASAGTDQYIKLWNVTIDANDPRAHTIDVQRAGKLFTPVADVSDMEVFGTESMCPKATEAANKSSPGLRKSQQSSEETLIGLLVCGVGMDVFQFAQLGQGARSASG
ncbi:MAG: hypothetical protein M1831_003623 [Alyxoria varia]|nr:MAG: hypothetical protein M1831_003623 [Alyxoria varia]